jgi:hypothetical protein
VYDPFFFVGLGFELRAPLALLLLGSKGPVKLFSFVLDFKELKNFPPYFFCDPPVIQQYIAQWLAEWLKW